METPKRYCEKCGAECNATISGISFVSETGDKILHTWYECPNRSFFNEYFASSNAIKIFHTSESGENIVEPRVK